MTVSFRSVGPAGMAAPQFGACPALRFASAEEAEPAPQPRRRLTARGWLLVLAAVAATLCGLTAKTTADFGQQIRNQSEQKALAEAEDRSHEQMPDRIVLRKDADLAALVELSESEMGAGTFALGDIAEALQKAKNPQLREWAADAHQLDMAFESQGDGDISQQQLEKQVADFMVESDALVDTLAASNPYIKADYEDLKANLNEALGWNLQNDLSAEDTRKLQTGGSVAFASFFTALMALLVYAMPEGFGPLTTREPRKPDDRTPSQHFVGPN